MIDDVLLLAQRDWPVPIRLVNASEIATVIHGGEHYVLGTVTQLVDWLNAHGFNITPRGTE